MSSKEFIKKLKYLKRPRIPRFRIRLMMSCIFLTFKFPARLMDCPSLKSINVDRKSNKRKRASHHP